jgi:maleylpyruvate isomerase
MQPTLTLYHYWRSSCSWRVRWALDLKGLSYESVPVNILTGEHLTESYRKKNPSGLLPSLELDGKFFGESLAILEWLEERWPNPALLPKDPLDRMVVRQLALTIVAGTQPLQNPSLIKYFEPDEAHRPKHMRHWIHKGLENYEALLTKTPAGTFSFGDTLTIADLCLVPQVYNALRFQVDLASMPRVKKVYDHCLTLPSCDRSAPYRQPGAQPT